MQYLLVEECKSHGLDAKGRVTWFDGEVVVIDRNGFPDFGALQNSFGNQGQRNALTLMRLLGER